MNFGVRKGWGCVAMAFAVLSTARGEIAFVGYLWSEGAFQFALADTEATAHAWVKLEGEFNGCRVVEFSKEKTILTIECDGSRRQLPLKDIQIAEPDAALVERDKEFSRVLGAMVRDISAPGARARRPTLDDLIAEAAKFGRVVIHRDLKDGHEVIIMDVPEEVRQKRYRFDYRATLPGKRKGDLVRTLIMH